MVLVYYINRIPILEGMGDVNAVKKIIMNSKRKKD